MHMKHLAEGYPRGYSDRLRPEVDSWLRPLSAALLTSLGLFPVKWEYSLTYPASRED